MSSLGDAWTEVEAVLPDGWAIYDLTKYAYDRDCDMEWPDDEWTARAGVFVQVEGFGRSYFDSVDSYGATPVLALDALAEALRQRDSQPEASRASS